MLKNGLYNAVGAGLRMGAALLAIPVLIRLIGIQEYGLWTLVSTVIALVSLAEAGLSVSTTVFLSRDLGNQDAEAISQTLTVTVGVMFLLATLVAIGLWIGAGTVVAFFPALEMSQRVVALKALQIGGVAIWARLLQQVLMGVEQAYQRYGLMNILMTVQSVLGSLGMLGVAWMGGRTVAMMQWQVVTSFWVLVAHAWASWLLVRGIQPRLVWNSAKGLEVMRYSLVTWLALLGSAVFSQVDRLIVGAVLGTGVLGIYAAITNVTSQINSFSALPVQPLLPSLSNQLVKSGSQSLIVQQVKQSLEINGVVALGIGAVLFIFAPLVMQVMISGAITHEYILAFRIATAIYSLYAVNAVGYYILFSVNAAEACMAIQLFSGTLSLILIAMGARMSGLLGAIVGNSGYLGVWLLTYWGMKQLGISLKLWVKWLQFPIVWFLSVVVCTMLLSDELLWKIILVVLHGILIVSWLLMRQGTLLKILIQKLIQKDDSY